MKPRGERTHWGSNSKARVGHPDVMSSLSISLGDPGKLLVHTQPPICSA